MTGGSKRWRSWPTSRILRSGLGSAGIPSACRIEPAIGSDLASRPPYTLNEQACRHIAPCRAVHGHYHVHSGKTGYPAADAGTRRFPDFGGQPYQSGWLSGIQPVRGGTISAWRSPAVIVSAVPAKISWVWRNRASSRKNARPTPCPPLRSIFSRLRHTRSAGGRGARHCGGVGRYGRQDPEGFRKPARQGAGRPQGRLLLGTFLQ